MILAVCRLGRDTRSVTGERASADAFAGVALAATASFAADTLGSSATVGGADKTESILTTSGIVSDATGEAVSPGFW
jgi:hypothetical protein